MPFYHNRIVNIMNTQPMSYLTVLLTFIPYQGRVECWDLRVRSRVGLLDCALSSVTEGTE